MLSLRSAALCCLVLFPALASGEEVPCSTPEQDLPQEGTAFTKPQEAETILHFESLGDDQSWKKVAGFKDFSGPLDAVRRDALAKNATSATGLAAIWSVGRGTCRQVIKTSVKEKVTAPSAFMTSPKASDPDCPTVGDPFLNCQTCASTWKSRLDQELRGAAYGLAVFTEAGDLCLVQNGTAGEPLYVAIYGDSDTAWDTLRYEPCSIEPDAPPVYVSTPGFSLDAARQRGTYAFRKYPARRCFNPTVDIRVTGRNGTSQFSIAHPMQQSQRYRATFQLGATFTKQHLHSFALRPVAGQSVVYDQGPTGTGPEYQASLVVYALPRNVLALFGTPYHGRDLVRDQGVLDRIGGTLGVSLSDPSRRFYTGLSFELLYGINVTYGVEFFRGRELAELAVGDPFPTDAGPIPTRERWDWDAFWGVSIDLVYAKELFSGRIRP